MNVKRWKTRGPALIAIAVCAPAFAAGADLPVKIGVLATRGAEKCLEEWNPTAEYLTERISGHSFSIVPLGFDEVRPAVERREVDFVLANPSIYVELEARYGAHRLVTMKHRCMGAECTSFGGLIFRRADREDIQHLGDLKGKTFMAVSETSFGGWQMAWRELKDAKIDPQRDFAELSFGGTDDAVVLAIRDGLADAGTVRSDTLKRMAAESVIQTGDFRLIDECALREGEALCRRSTRLYPGWPLAEVVHTSNEFAEAVAIAMLSMPADSPAAKAAECTGWTVPLNYQPVHECLKDLRVGPYKDLGKITLGAMVRQYWPGLLAAIGFLTLSAFTTSYVLRLNGRLRQSIAAERKELAERKQAEEALREVERRSRAILDQTFQFIGLLTPEGTLVEANRSALDFAGVEASDVTGKAFWDTPWWTHSPDLQERLRHAVSRAAAGEFDRFEASHVAADGSLHHMDFSLKPVRDENGNVSLLIPEGRDITERKRAEAALRESEETVRALLNAATDVVVLVDVKGTTLAANETLAQRLGRPADELIGRCIYDFFSPEVARIRRAKGDEVCRTGKPIRHVDEHAGRCWGYVVQPLFDLKGSVDRLAVFGRDITEQRQAEVALAESEARFRALFEQAPDSIVLVDAERGSPVEFNDRACENLGYTRAEFQDLTVGDLDAIESSEAVVAHTKRIIRDGGDTFETKHRTKTGQIRDVLVTSRGVSIGGRDFALAIWRDMTERKRMEDELRKFKTISDRATYGAAISDLDGNLTYVNGAFADMHAHASAELIGRSLSSLHTKEQLPRVNALNERLRGEGSYSAEEVWHKRADGSVFPTLMNATTIVDETGSPSFLAATVIDISELKEAEQALRRSEERLQFLLTVGPAVIYTCQVGGDYRAHFVSRNVEAQLGYPAEMFLSDPGFWSNNIHPEDAPRVFAELPSLLDRDQHTHEYRFQHKDGTWRWMRDETRLVRDADGNPVEIVGCWIDITERKRAEETLRRQALVFENMFDAVVVTGPDHRITEWNPAATRIFGYTRDEVLGTTAQILHRPEDKPEQFRQITEALEHDGYWSDVSPFGRKDGGQGHCEATIVALRDEKDRWVGNVAVVHDISDRVHAEQEAQRRQSELAHVVRLATMGEMATGLAHELNQPLSAILYYAHGCRRRLRAGACDTEETLNITEKIAAQAERAAAFLDRIRAFVRKGELRLAPVDLNQAVREAASFAAYQARESGVMIDFQLATPLPPVLADMIQIEQVVLNVLRNGIESMQASEPDRRRLTIQTSRDGDAVICAIADTGCGYSDETAEQLFDAFFTTKSAGMGMGLAISRSIITAHGGRIWATPNPDGGITFQFALPVSEAGAMA